MRLLAFDFETHKIGPDLCGCGEIHGQFPPAVCLTWADDEGRSGIDTPVRGLQRLQAALCDKDCIIIGANTAFDVHVACAIGSRLGCVDCSLGQGLLRGPRQRRACAQALARPGCRAFQVSPAQRRASDARQARPCRRREETLGIRLDKSEDTWRLRYSELDGVPFEQWPKEALEYAVRDAEITGMVYEAQENWREHKLYCGIPSLWYGKLVLPDGDEPDPLQSEFYESYHALWLSTMSGHVGVMVDEFALEQYEKRMLLEYQDLVQVVRKHGMLRREYWRDLTKLRGTEWAGNARWRELKGALDVDDPEALSAWEELKAEGLVRWKHCKNTSAAKQRVVDVFNLAGRDIPVTDGFDKAMKLFKRGEGPEPRREDHVALDSDTCRIGGLLEIELDMPVQKLQAYADLVHVAKAVNTDIPKIRPGIERPLHTHFTTILETGRTSSAGPPLQNRDRGRDDVAGDRECFIPTREGYVYIDIDYPQLELYCFAQCAKWIVGYSTMGDALLRGEDLHTALGGVIAGLSQLRRGRTRRTKTAGSSNDRLCAKPLNFGRHRRARRQHLVVFAAKGYGVYRPKPTSGRPHRRIQRAVGRGQAVLQAHRVERSVRRLR
jgi:hypothetical protein